MQYSSYVRLLGAISLVAFIVLAVLFIAIAGPAGWFFVLVVGGALLFGFLMSIAWAHRAVSEFAGAPFPGIWGVLGFDVTPDDPDLSDDDDEAEATALARPVGAAGQSWAPSAVSTADSRPVGGGGEGPQTCPSCGAVTTGGGSKYCRVCGAPLPGAAP